MANPTPVSFVDIGRQRQATIPPGASRRWVNLLCVCGTTCVLATKADVVRRRLLKRRDPKRSMRKHVVVQSRKVTQNAVVVRQRHMMIFSGRNSFADVVVRVGVGFSPPFVLGREVEASDLVFLLFIFCVSLHQRFSRSLKQDRKGLSSPSSPPLLFASFAGRSQQSVPTRSAERYSSPTFDVRPIGVLFVMRVRLIVGESLQTRLANVEELVLQRMRDKNGLVLPLVP